jgi:hypothetical protein
MEINSGVEADREARDFTASIASAFVYNSLNILVQIVNEMGLQKKNIEFIFLRYIFVCACCLADRLCGLVVRGPGYMFKGPGSIPGSTRFSVK